VDSSERKLILFYKTIMKAKSIKGKTAADIISYLDKVIEEGLRPTVAIIFIAVESEREVVSSAFKERGIEIFGASSGGNFIDEEIESDAIVALLLEMNPSNFLVELLTSNDGNKIKIAEQIGKAGSEKFSKPSFLVISGGMTTDGDEIIAGIENVCGTGTVIFGGLAADSFKMERTYVFNNSEISDNGLIALILDDEKVSLGGIAIGGWKPMGIERTITSSKGNVVYTIDNEPALDFISRYAGIKDIDTEHSLGLLLSSNFQLQLRRENKHPVMRTPLMARKEDRAIIFAGGLPEGSKVRLCLLPSFEVIEAALKDFAKYKEDHKKADALIMFSCAGRQMSLGPYITEEITGVKELWGAPMAGFFCFGEIGKVENGDHEFHNMTCSLAILRENN